MEPNGWINTAPEKPNIPSGEIFGEPGVEYTYTTYSEDSDNHSILYKWDWGDGSYSEWLGPYNSGDETSSTHSWSEGDYEIRVKVKDTRGAESDWSESLTVNIGTSIKTVFLFGFISNLSESNDSLSFNANNLLWLSSGPFNLQLYSSGESIICSDKYLAILRESFVLGFFNAAVV